MKLFSANEYKSKLKSHEKLEHPQINEVLKRVHLSSNNASWVNGKEQQKCVISVQNEKSFELTEKVQIVLCLNCHNSFFTVPVKWMIRIKNKF